MMPQDWRWGVHPAYREYPESRCQICGAEIPEDECYCKDCREKVNAFMDSMAREFSFLFDVEIPTAKTEIEQYEFTKY